MKAQERVREACRKLAQGQTGAGKDQFPDWLLSSAFADDMGTDFMAPLLRGVLSVGLERGTSVSRFWESQFGWAGKTNQKGFSAARTPLLFVNACDVDSGLRSLSASPRCLRRYCGGDQGVPRSPPQSLSWIRPTSLHWPRPSACPPISRGASRWPHPGWRRR